MRKFLLLPEDSDHNVSVFYHTNTSQQSSNDVESFIDKNQIIPHPPDHFFGREVDIYNILQSLSRFRLVRITGEPGIGKGSLAAAVCHYINSRRRCFRMETVIWLPLLNSPSEDTLMSALHRVFDIIQNESFQVSLREDCEFRRVCGIVVEKLYQKNALLAVDARQFAGELPMEKLFRFLEYLLRATKKVRIILIHSNETQRWWQCPCAEAQYELGTLHFKASALLFGVATPFVGGHCNRKAQTPRHFSNLIVNEDAETSKIGDDTLSKRSLKIFQMIGGGNPAKVLESARTIAPRRFDELISLGEKEDFHPEFSSRVELESHLMQHQRDIEDAVSRKDFKAASELYDAQNDLKLLLNSFPSLLELKKQRSALERSIKVALSKSDYTGAQALQDSLNLVTEKQTREEEALGETKPAAADASFNTRAEIDMQICKLEAELRLATANGVDFARAKVISAQLSRLQESCKSFPSKSDLQAELQSMSKALEDSIRQRRIDSSEMLHQIIQELNGQISQEEEAENRLRSEQANQAEAGPGAFASYGTNEESSMKAKNNQKLVAAKGQCEKAARFRRSSFFLSLPTPETDNGNDAISVAVGDEAEPEVGMKVENVGMGFPEDTEGNVRNENQEAESVTLDADDVENNEEEDSQGAEEERPETDLAFIPRPETDVDFCSRPETDVAFSSRPETDAAFRSRPGAMWSRPPERPEWSGISDRESEWSGLSERAPEPEGEHGGDTALQAAECDYDGLPIAAVVVDEDSEDDAAPGLTTIAEDGHVVTEEELAALRRKNGWCPCCGVTRTHAKKWPGRLRPLNNQYVLHGRCLQCYYVVDESATATASPRPGLSGVKKLIRAGKIMIQKRLGFF